MDCSICMNKLFSLACCALNCGHMFHTVCLQSWKNRGENSCPNCRKPATNMIDLYPPSIDINSDGLEAVMTNIVSIKSDMDEKNREMKFSMELLLDSTRSVTNALEELKKDNAEMKKQIRELEFCDGGTIDADSREKNKIIATLKKENQEMKTKRAEESQKMIEIQQQIVVLKRNAKDRTPLGVTTNDENHQQQPRAITLSLKFDDLGVS